MKSIKIWNKTFETEVELLCCPFCGKTESLEFTDAKELEECAKFESEDCPCYEEEPRCYCKAVVCSIQKGGCGATSGYAGSIEKAIKKWNVRTE